MGQTIGTAYIQIVPSTQGIQGQLEKAMSGEGAKAGKSAGSNFSQGFASVIGGAASAVVGATAAAAGAVTALTSQAVAGFGRYEQLVGGVETLFDGAASTVISNAERAFQTAGLSANDYMDTVTSFSASMIQSLAGDTVKAAQYADQAIIDMSDNANKMGTSMESIQNAYQGFAKQNYTMLDNLKLGYGGTKAEMERLLADAEKLAGLGEGTFDVSNFSDITQAIHIIQTEMGLTGTTSKEAAATIEGSTASMKAAWDNLVTGMGTDGADLDGLINTFVGTLQTSLTNLAPTILTALSGISTLITQLAPMIATGLPTLVQTLLPSLLVAAQGLVSGFISSLVTVLPAMIPQIITFVSGIGNLIIQNLPALMEASFQMINQLSLGLASALPTLIPTIVDLMLTIVDAFVNNVDLLVDAAIAITVALADGLVNQMPVLIAKAPTIVMKLAQAIVRNAPKLLVAAVGIITTLANGVLSNIPKLLGVAVKVIVRLVEKFNELKDKFLSVGENIVKGIREGIENAWSALVEKVKTLAGKLVESVKNFFQIESPSRLMANEIGKFIPAGIALGIDANADEAIGAMDSLSSRMNTAVTSARNTLNGSYMTATSNNDSEVAALLATYLPMIASGKNVNVNLNGDTSKFFDAMVKENNKYKKRYGNTAFA